VSGEPAAPAPYLRIEGLSKRFGEFTALRDVSLDIQEGEFVCFLGPSGCGKTTLLRAIAGLDVQSEGRIEQGGVDVSVLPPSQRDFGIVFQSYALFPNMTVSRNVAYGLENTRRPRQEVAARVEELLELVGLPEQGDKYPAQLSGGQQQRVALARALAISPGLLLLDEPLSALDARVRAHLRHEVKALQRRLGVTTIMVTHDQEEALTMADRIVVMSRGAIEQIGTPMVVYREPATAFVADFIGTMNFLRARVEGGGLRLGDRVLAFDTGRFRLGETVTVAIRPEDVTLKRGNGADAANGTDGPATLVPAIIEYVEFLGAFARIALALDTGGEHRVRADVPTAHARDLALREGARVEAALSGADVRVYREARPDG
jgi:iron(III) transport system ATP-binding protein